MAGASLVTQAAAADGSEIAAVDSECIETLRDQMRRGGLAVGTGNPGNEQFGAGIIVEARSDYTDPLRQPFNGHARNRQGRRAATGHRLPSNRRSACLQCLRDMVTPVSA